jgi:DNA-directed RNA polymerase specialized sigma24 family protein
VNIKLRFAGECGEQKMFAWITIILHNTKKHYFRVAKRISHAGVLV